MTTQSGDFLNFRSSYLDARQLDDASVTVTVTRAEIKKSPDSPVVAKMGNQTSQIALELS